MKLGSEFQLLLMWTPVIVASNHASLVPSQEEGQPDLSGWDEGS